MDFLKQVAWNGAFDVERFASPLRTQFYFEYLMWYVAGALEEGLKECLANPELFI